MGNARETTRSSEPKTFIPADETEELLKFAKVINGINLAAEETATAALISVDGDSVPIPAELFDVLKRAANVLALGDGITILPSAAKLTTQEAADFLGMSRPTLVKLLESGLIPFEKVGRHRRVTLRDVVAYQQKAQAERRQALASLAKESAELYEHGTKAPTELKRLSEFEK